jgi:hypothetical protein
MAVQEINLYCDKCTIFSAHEIILEHVDKDNYIELASGESLQVPVEDVYRIVRCKNCSTVSGQNEYLIDGETHSQNQFFPNSSRKLPNWSKKLPADIYSALVEVYNALRSGSYRLVVIGCRTLVEMSSNNKIGDIGGFETKIGELQKIGILNDSTKLILSRAVEAGNASVHRGWQPTQKESHLALDIVEHFLHLEVLATEASDLDKSVPKRQRNH